MILLRKAQCSDANAIALLHVASWRDTYRNVMSLDFLENHAEDELISHWQHLLNQSSPDVSVFVAEKKGIIQGFICVMLNKNAQWGTYINSLHVSSELRGQEQEKDCCIIQQNGYAERILNRRFTCGYLRITSGQSIFTRSWEGLSQSIQYQTCPGQIMLQCSESAGKMPIY